MSALGGSKWGLSLFEKRTLYNACIAPRALYAAPIWQLPRIQGRCSVMISNYKRSTPSSAGPATR